MTAGRRGGRPGATWGSLLLLGMIGGALTLAPQAAQAVDDGSNISVNVTDGSSPSPTPSPSGSASDGSGTGDGTSNPGGLGGSTPGGSVGSSTGGTGTTPGGSPSNAPTPSPGEVGVAGMLYVGGLQASAATSPNPAEGVVTLWVTVRNASTSAFDATARFWMNSSIFRNDLDVEEQVAIPALQPGETRMVSVQLHHGGQWTLIDAHVTITPPDSVDGTALTPVTRDATVFLFPWLISLVLVVGAVGFILVRVARGVVVDPIPLDAT